jgi:predicted phage-related endonuclease
MITDKQRLERRKHLGSSDIAALFTGMDGKSLDPFKNAVDVFNTKVYELDDDTETVAQNRGNRYEAAMIQYVEEQTGQRVETNPDNLRYVNIDILGSDRLPIFAANLDGYIPADVTAKSPTKPIIVEAKTTSMGDEWGTPGTDEVPDRVNLQIHHQMLCTGWELAYVVVLRSLFGRLDESLYTIKRDERIIQAITKRGKHFWNEYVLTGTPPPDSEPGDIRIYKRIVRTPDKYANVPVDYILAWNEAKQARIDAEKAEKEALSALFEKLGDAEGAAIDDEREFTYFEQNSAPRIDFARLKAEWPDVYAAISTPNTCRVPRIHKITKKG